MVHFSDLILFIRRTLLTERHISHSWISLPDDLASFETCRRCQTCCLVTFRSRLRFLTLSFTAIYLQILSSFYGQILIVTCACQTCLTRTCFIFIIIILILREVGIMTAFIEEIFLDLLTVKLFQIVVVVLEVVGITLCDDAVWVVVCVSLLFGVTELGLTFLAAG